MTPIVQGHVKEIKENYILNTIRAHMFRRLESSKWQFNKTQF